MNLDWTWNWTGLEAGLEPGLDLELGLGQIRHELEAQELIAIGTVFVGKYVRLPYLKTARG